MNATLTAPATRKYPRKIFDRRALLKVKIKSLAEESKIIHLEEQRNKYLRTEMHEHRVINVRRESRASQLAYGFIRGRAYTSIEEGACTSPNWVKVEAMVLKYGITHNPDIGDTDNARNFDTLKHGFNDWRAAAKVRIKANMSAYTAALEKAKREKAKQDVQLT